MPRIQVQAGQSMLEGYVKKPGVGLCELAWNAFDEDATTVAISIETNGLGGIEQIRPPVRSSPRTCSGTASQPAIL